MYESDEPEILLELAIYINLCSTFLRDLRYLLQLVISESLEDSVDVRVWSITTKYNNENPTTLKHVVTYKLHDTMKITTMNLDVVNFSAKKCKETVKLNLQKNLINISKW